MTKVELVDAVASKAGITKKDAAAAVSAVVDTIKQSVAAGDEVRLVGFGTFSSVTVPAKTGKLHFGDGGTWEKPEHKAPKFKAGKSFKELVEG